MIKQTKAFTLVELLVVVAIIALLVSILLPTLGRAKELAKQVKCTANVSAIAKGWMLYTKENRGAPPILPDIGAINGTGDGCGWPICWKNPLQMGDECTAAALGYGAQQNLCLLVKSGVVDWGVFLCPSTGHKKADRNEPGRKWGMGETDAEGVDRSYCDYALQAPYRWMTANNRNYCPLNIHTDGGVAILADNGPSWSTSDAMNEWSQNHPNDGESVMYAGGNVRFSKDVGVGGSGGDPSESKNTAGWGGNNIYTGDEWDWDSGPTLLYNGRNHPGYRGRSSRDTVLFWWPEKSK